MRTFRLDARARGARVRHAGPRRIRPHTARAKSHGVPRLHRRPTRHAHVGQRQPGARRLLHHRPPRQTTLGLDNRPHGLNRRQGRPLLRARAQARGFFSSNTHTHTHSVPTFFARLPRGDLKRARRPRPPDPSITTSARRCGPRAVASRAPPSCGARKPRRRNYSRAAPAPTPWPPRGRPRRRKPRRLAREY